jgi:TolB-like protein/predicted Zn-dependent protease
VALATTHFFGARFGWSEDRGRSAARATQFAQKGLAIDGSEVDAYVQLSNLAMLQRNHEQAEAYCEKALALNPTADVTSNCARIWTYLGRPREALPLINRAMRLSPYYPANYLFALGNAHRMMGNYDEAIAALKAWRDRSPNSPFPYDMLAITYAEAGREKEARAAAAELLKVKPDFTLKWLAKLLMFKDPAENKHFLDVLRKLGIPENPPLKLPDKPSIAVLPFTNMSGDPEQEYFADGITEDIITDLSKISGLFVIARNSSFQYKGKSPDLRAVGRELGVKYVLEGSVRRAGDQVRINAQLVDAGTGGHIWAERYDGELKDVFALQDKVTRRVVSELAVTLKANEQERLFRRHTENLEAYDTFLRARRLLALTRDPGVLAKRKRLFERVIEVDPGFAGGYAGLSFHYARRVRQDRSTSRKADIDRAFDLAQQAVAADDTFGWSYVALGSAYLMKGEHDRAIAAIREAIRIQPSDADAQVFLGYYLHWAGRAKEAIDAVKRAARLNPKARRHIQFLGMAYVTAGQYADAIVTFNQRYSLLARVGSNSLAFLAAAYAATGQDEKARAAMQVFLDKHPGFTLSNYHHPRLYKRPEDRDRYLNLLRKAGLPE